MRATSAHTWRAISTTGVAPEGPLGLREVRSRCSVTQARTLGLARNTCRTRRSPPAPRTSEFDHRGKDFSDPGRFSRTFRASCPLLESRSACSRGPRSSPDHAEPRLVRPPGACSRNKRGFLSVCDAGARWAARADQRDAHGGRRRGELHPEHPRLRLYRADQDVDELVELYYAPSSGAVAAVQINAAARAPLCGRASGSPAKSRSPGPQLTPGARAAAPGAER